MKCPSCGAKVNLEESKCGSCGAEFRTGGFIKVISTGDKPLLAIIKSVLTDAGIEHFVKGEVLQDIIGIGGFGAGYNLAAGPMELFVKEEDAEAVQTLINELEENQAWIQ